MVRHQVILLLTVFIFLDFSVGFAQTKDSTLIYKSADQLTADSLDKQVDFFDFVDKVFHLHLSAKPDTSKLKPGRLFFAVIPGVGYTLEGSWLASLTLNSSFYTATRDSTNLSSVNTGLMYTLRHQIIFPIISNIWTKNNKLDWLGDWRYYKYPSYTYGLGGNTSLSNADLVDYSYIRIYQEVLRHFNSYFYAGGGYNYDNHFDIKEMGENADFDTYNEGATQTISSGLVFHVMYDTRKNVNNPRKATYFSITYRYNTPLLGSNSEWQSIFPEFKKYIQLSPSSTNVLALWSWNVFTFGGNAPYFDLPSNGWDINSNSGRGYIQGRFRGQNMLYDEAEYRFRITNNGLLGGVIFANAESVSNYPDNKFAGIDPGEGFGLRIKMNKYSDVNLCIDYGFGLMGSRGFFANLGEVF